MHRRVKPTRLTLVARRRRREWRFSSAISRIGGIEIRVPGRRGRDTDVPAKTFQRFQPITFQRVHARSYRAALSIRFEPRVLLSPRHESFHGEGVRMPRRVLSARKINSAETCGNARFNYAEILDGQRLRHAVRPNGLQLYASARLLEFLSGRRIEWRMGDVREIVRLIRVWKLRLEVWYRISTKVRGCRRDWLRPELSNLSKLPVSDF